MIINYSLAKGYAEWVQALALGEHWGHVITPACVYGQCPHGNNDNGQAFGLLQQHPSFVIQYGRDNGDFAISVSDTWPDAQIKAAATFLDIWEHLGLDLAVQAYNLGATAVLNGARNPEYLQHFHDALNQVRGGK